MTVSDYTNFRDYLGLLERKGRLLRVNKEVDARYQIAAGIRKISDNDGPALLFENVKDYPGWKVVGGLFATQRLMAAALGVENNEDKLLQRYLEFDQKYLKTKLVSSGAVKEVVLTGKDIDLTKLPIPIYCEKDATAYLTAGVEIARHPETGIQNASIHRRMLLGKDKTTLLVPPKHHLGMIFQAAEEKGQRVEVATVLGAHPAITLASQLKAPMGVDEMEIAGAIAREPIEVVKCQTIDVDVPADAEIVIEGVATGERVPDGSFGEYPGNYISLLGNPSASARVIKITAITMRKDAIFQAMLTGMPMTENHCLKKWAYAAGIYRHLESLLQGAEDIKGINLTVGGTAAHHVVVAIHKRTERQPRDIITGLLSHDRLGLSQVTVVDEDIDIYNPIDVEWAVCTRIQADRDIIILPTFPPPSPEAVGTSLSTTKWGIDATLPLTKGREWYVRAVPPGVDKVDYV